MRARLMHRDRDFDVSAPIANEQDLRQDLELDTLLGAMAGGDRLVFDVARVALLTPLRDREEIRFRQAILRDCRARPEVVRELFTLALEAVRGQREHMRFYWRESPESIKSASLGVLTFFVERLHALRQYADRNEAGFQSEGLRRLCGTLRAELADDYLTLVERQLETMKLERGTLISARLDEGNKGVDHVLRVPPELGWRERFGQLRRPPHSFDIHPRDQASLSALGVLTGRGLNLAANALAQSADHIKAFFSMLLTELAFYVGCLNLDERLRELGAATCIPEPIALGVPSLRAEDLYDVSLALRLGVAVVGNTVDADGKRLVVITGANQGGKSTFLRSLGQARLMLQSGMFVAARSLRSDVRDGLYTHYKREEDASMESGKLDEELARMSAIASSLTPGSELLCNESFAATNEREGSEIARQVTAALTEAGVRVVFVTHLFDFADAVARQSRDDVLFLRAPRGEDGARTYRLVQADPLPTSYGEDTYRRVFG
jgi:MutS domain V